MKRIFLAVLGALGAQAANAGVYVELVDRDIASGKTELSQKIYVQNGLGRFVDAAGRATLIKDGMKIDAVALTVGYRSKKNFYRQFRRRFATTPFEYRQRFARADA